MRATWLAAWLLDVSKVPCKLAADDRDCRAMPLNIITGYLLILYLLYIGLEFEKQPSTSATLKTRRARNIRLWSMIFCHNSANVLDGLPLRRTNEVHYLLKEDRLTSNGLTTMPYNKGVQMVFLMYLLSHSWGHQITRSNLPMDPAVWPCRHMFPFARKNSQFSFFIFVHHSAKTGQWWIQVFAHNWHLTPPRGE